MRHARAVWLQRLLLVVFTTILVLLPFHAFISTWGGTAIGPLFAWKGWKEFLLFGIVPLVVLYLILRPDVARLVWRGWLTKLILIYVGLHVVLAIVSPASLEAIIAGAAMNLRFLAIFGLAQVIIASDDSWAHAIKRWVEPWLFVTTIIISLLAIAQVTVIPKDYLAQFGYNKETTIAPYVLIDDNPDALRAFATLRGPNTLGAYLVLPLLLALVAVFREPRNILAGMALGLGTVALVATSSRSAWLGLAVGVVVLGFIALHGRGMLKVVKWGVVPAIVLGGILTWLIIAVPAVRLTLFHASPGDPSLLEGSNEAHWRATGEGLQDAASHPMGQGIGTAGPASFYNTNGHPKIAENYFVQLAQEIGFAGLALFVVICGILVLRLWRHRQRMWPKVLLASFAGLTVINIFQHGWADDPSAMTWWAIAGLYALGDNKTKATKHVQESS
jgi:hypothetical protein